MISFNWQYKEYLIILSVFVFFSRLPRRHKLHIFRACDFKTCLRGLSIISLLLLSPKSLADFLWALGCTVFTRKYAVFILTAVARARHLSEKQVGRGYIRAASQQLAGSS